jgi:hypothetical protein
MDAFSLTTGSALKRIEPDFQLARATHIREMGVIQSSGPDQFANRP